MFIVNPSHKIVDFNKVDNSCEILTLLIVLNLLIQLNMNILE